MEQQFKVNVDVIQHNLIIAKNGQLQFANSISSCFMQEMSIQMITIVIIYCSFSVDGSTYFPFRFETYFLIVGLSWNRITNCTY
jgi:hypothetical protein